MMDQTGGRPVVFVAAADLQRLPQRVSDHAGVFGGGDPPAQDRSGEHVDNECDVDETGQRPHIGEVGHPQLVDPSGSMPATLDQVRVPRRGLVALRSHGAMPPADGAGDPGQTHQPGHLVAAEVVAGAASRMPQLAGTVDAPVVLPQRPQLVGQVSIVHFGVGEPSLAAGVEGGRRDYDPGLGQDRTDRLDAERLAVGVDVVHDHRSPRSSSAWAKNAAEVFKISFARSSSLTRRRNARTSSDSADLGAGLRPDSTRSRSSAQFRNVSGFRSSNTPTWRRAPRFDSPGSASRSRYIRTARSRNSWSYFLGTDMC